MKPCYTGNGLVCPNEDGTVRTPDDLSRAYCRFPRRTELPPIRFHDLRHTHATLLLLANVHPKVVSERLGHSSIGITLDTYFHVLPSMDQQAADALDRILRDGTD